jgi:acetyl-CoA carboxylase biotin carboxylase subunit
MKRILIANRGEIALRIIKAAREMGVETVTIFTEEEQSLPHACLGDYGACLGQGNLKETYLNMAKIIDIAQSFDCQAVHPGYGFLSENAEFAKVLSEKKIKLIGPPVAAMQAMGDKKTSKDMMNQIGVPVIPGYHGADQTIPFLKEKALEIGLPILIKASAGGGGKGMRIVHSEDEFEEALAQAKREAQNAFGNDDVLVEKFIQNPRHIEVQVMSDEHDQHFHLFERECSIQRRYQKIVEETPSPALSDKLRQEMTECAVKISREMKYVGAGTVEFILDESGEFFFLEMNTRLQVEHPITEMVTGIDLVQAQIKVARGEKLDWKQENIYQRGHALEVRLYAEDPENNFLPSIGKIIYRGTPHVLGARLDTGYEDGNEVTISFDPMLAKLIVYSTDRANSIQKMQLALDEVPFMGLKTNREYLKRILKHQKFIEGETFTHFIQTYSEDLLERKDSHDDIALSIAAFLLTERRKKQRVSTSTQTIGPWDTLGPVRN